MVIFLSVKGKIRSSSMSHMSSHWHPHSFYPVPEIAGENSGIPFGGEVGSGPSTFIFLLSMYCEIMDLTNANSVCLQIVLSGGN